MIPQFLHFTIKELFTSSTGVKLGLDPYCFTDEARVDEYMRQYHPREYGNLLFCVRYFLDPIRLMFGRPIKVTSSFRTVRLNVEVGGVVNSWHVHGCAFDLVCNSDHDLQCLFMLLSKISTHMSTLSCFNYGKYLHLQFELTKEQKELALGMLDYC